MYYLRSRYYDSEVGRFINADNQLNLGAVLLGLNVFAYCNSNPVDKIDPDGHIPFMLITAGIGAVTGAVVGGIVVAKNGGNVRDGIGTGAIAGGLLGLGAGAAASAIIAGSATATMGVVVAGGKTLMSTTAAGILSQAEKIFQNTESLYRSFISG